MPDVRVQVTGDASGAVDAFDQVGEHAESVGEVVSGKLAASFATAEAAVELATRAFEALKDTLKESIQLALEDEQANTRLGFALKNVGITSTEAKEGMIELAEALEKQTGTSKESIKSTEQMLLQMGIMATDVPKVTQMSLDLAAAFGIDSVQAARMLGSAIETEHIGRLGRLLPMLTEQDLKMRGIDAIYEAMANVHGAAGAAMDTEAGKVKQLSLSWDNLKEAVGAAGIKLADNAKILAIAYGPMFAALNLSVNDMMKGITDALDKITGRGDASIAGALKKITEGSEGQAQNLPSMLIDIPAIEAQARKAAAAGAKALMDATAESRKAIHGVTLDDSDRAHAEFQKQFEEAKVKAHAESEKKIEEIDAKYDEAVRTAQKKEQEALAQHNTKLAALYQDEENRLLGDKADFDAKALAGQEALSKKEEEALVRSEEAKTQILQRELQKREQETQKYEQLGLKLGDALVRGFGDGMKTVGKQGGGFDTKALLKDIIPPLIDIALTEVTGGTAAPFLGLVNQGITSLMGIAGFAQGGWVDHYGVQHFAGGGGVDTIPAMLSPGEYVLSHQMIANMGGPAAVESAASGGGSTHVYISAVDSQSFTEAMSGRFGSASIAAAQRGHGEWGQMLSRAGIG